MAGFSAGDKDNLTCVQWNLGGMSPNSFLALKMLLKMTEGGAGELDPS